MTTAPTPDIVPAMPPAAPALSLVKSGDVRDVPGHLSGNEQDVPERRAGTPQDDTERPGPFGNGVPGQSAGTPQDVPGHPGPFDNDVPGQSADPSEDIPERPGTFDNDVPGQSGDDTEDTEDVPGDTEDIPRDVPDISLGGLSKAAAVRHIWQTISTPTRPATWGQVAAWLEAHDVDVDQAYARRIVRTEIDARATASRPNPTPARPVEPAIDTAALLTDPTPAPDIDPPIDTAPAGPVPAVPVDAAPATRELAARVADSRARLPLQVDSALFDALSDEEIAAERALSETIRARRRKIREHQSTAELARAQADEREAASLAKEASKNARWHRRAVASRDRLASEEAKLTQLYRRAEWSARALVGVVILGMVWSGVNVQRNMVPSGDKSDPLYWLSYGVEAMISIPIIVIMLVATTAARWGRHIPRGGVVAAEIGLLSLTVGLNAGPHIASGTWGKAGEFAIAPVMVGVVIWLHSWVSGAYAKLITGAEDAQAHTEETTR